MKKVGIFTFIAVFLISLGSNASSIKDTIKERQEIAKASKKELNEKASKAARKEAKKLEKDGWKSAPGALPIEKQLDKSYLMQMEYDDDMFPKYIMAEAMSVGENYDAAKLQAMELAKQNLAGQIQTEVTALIDNSVANQQLSAEQAASITKTIIASKNLITQSIGRTVPVVEVYRVLKNKNKEVLVRIAYNSEMAKAAAKKALYNDMNDELDNMHSTLDKILGW